MDRNSTSEPTDEVGASAPDLERERLRLLLRSAEEEIGFIRGKVAELTELGLAELRQAIRAQTGMIDERDRYIQQLEARVDQQAAALDRLREWERQTAWLRRPGPLRGALRALQSRKPPGGNPG